MRGTLAHVCKAFRQQAQEAVPCSRHLVERSQVQATVTALRLASQRLDVCGPGRKSVDLKAPFRFSTGRSAVSFAAAQAQPEIQSPLEDLVLTDSAVEVTNYCRKRCLSPFRSYRHILCLSSTLPTASVRGQGPKCYDTTASGQTSIPLGQAPKVHVLHLPGHALLTMCPWPCCPSSAASHPGIIQCCSFAWQCQAW